MKYWKQAITVSGVFLVCLTAGIRAEDKPPAATPDMKGAQAQADAAVPQGGIEVMRMVLCKDVKDREPGPDITTAKVGEMVTGWSQIRSGLGETTVTHRWLHEKENLGDVPLTIKMSPWRTWSRKTVSEPGNWTWQILNSQGVVLKETSFTVTP